MDEKLTSRMVERFPRISDEEAAELSGGIDPWSPRISKEDQEKITQLCKDVPGYFFWLLMKGGEKRPIYNTAWKYRPANLKYAVFGSVRSVDMGDGDFRKVLLDYIRTDHKNLADRDLTIRAWFYGSGHLLILATEAETDRPSTKLIVSTIPAVIERHGAKLVKTDFEPAVLAALFDLQYKEHQ